MARSETIGRLYAREDANFANSPQPVKLVNLTDSQAAEPSLLDLYQRSLLRRVSRFSLGRDVSRFDGHPELMSSMQPAAPLDRSGDFRALAAEQHFQQLARARFGRGRRDGAVSPRIQL
jgi:hypothetical protein